MYLKEDKTENRRFLLFRLGPSSLQWTFLIITNSLRRTVLPVATFFLYSFGRVYHGESNTVRYIRSNCARSKFRRGTLVVGTYYDDIYIIFFDEQNKQLRFTKIEDIVFITFRYTRRYIEEISLFSVTIDRGRINTHLSLRCC